ncbi:hypothetical protein [Streptomyces sp. NPDC020951]
MEVVASDQGMAMRRKLIAGQCAAEDVSGFSKRSRQSQIRPREKDYDCR